jgi:hypothetical protein
MHWTSVRLFIILPPIQPITILSALFFHQPNLRFKPFLIIILQSIYRLLLPLPRFPPFYRRRRAGNLGGGLAGWGGATIHPSASSSTQLPSHPLNPFIVSSFHHYIVSSFHRFIISSLHHSIVPSFHRFIISSLHHFIVPSFSLCSSYTLIFFIHCTKKP